MEAFQSTLQTCALSYLSYMGPKFTWSNSQEGLYFQKERLDRVVENQGWCDLFSHADVSVGAAISSDHSSLFINLVELGIGQKSRRTFYNALKIN